MMHTYVINGFQVHPDELGQLPTRIVLPAEDIDPATIKLSDYSKAVACNSVGLAACMTAAFALIDDGIIFVDPPVLAPSRWVALKSKVRLFLARRSAALDRWYLWNVKFPAKEWRCRKFDKMPYHGPSIDDLRKAIRAELKVHEVKDSDMPYPIDTIEERRQVLQFIR